MKDVIRKYQFKKGLNHEFEILDTSELFQSNKELMTKPHRAQFYQILWNVKARGNHIIDFNPISIEDSTIVFIPQNSVSIFDNDGFYEGKIILFTDNFFCKNNEDVKYLQTSILFSDLYNSAKIRVNPEMSDLKVLFNAMETEFRRNPDSSQYNILLNMLHIFLLQSEREILKQGFKELKKCPYLDTLVLFKEVLEKNFRKKRLVNKYATELNISEKQLHKATKTVLDKTPKQIIDERVVLEAKRLLAHSSDSIKEIAYGLSYEEPTNFIKYFRKHTNYTPSEFREQFYK